MTLVLKEPAERVVSAVTQTLDRYVRSFAATSVLFQDSDPARWNARGVLPEALLSIDGLLAFLETAQSGLERYFDRGRVLLFEGDQPIGSLGLGVEDEPEVEVEHVTRGGSQDLVDALTAADHAFAGVEARVRLLRVPALYLEALVLSVGDQSPRFLVFQPLREATGNQHVSREDFADGCVRRLLDRHRREFPIR